jgi:predicted small integral membrane protein
LVEFTAMSAARVSSVVPAGRPGLDVFSSVGGAFVAAALPMGAFALTTALAARSMGWASLLAASGGAALLWLGLSRLRYHARRSPRAAALIDAHDRAARFFAPIAVLLSLIAAWEAASVVLGIDSGAGSASSALRVVGLGAVSLGVLALSLIAYAAFTRPSPRRGGRAIQVLLGLAALSLGAAAAAPARATVARLDDAPASVSATLTTVAVGEVASAILVAAWVWALPREATAVAIARGGLRFATSRAGRIALGSPHAARPLARSSGGQRLLRFTPDDQHLLADRPHGVLACLDAASGALVRRLADADSPLCAVAASPDGTRVAALAEDRRLHVWDLATGALTHSFQTGCALGTSLAFSPDGATLIAANHAGFIARCSLARPADVARTEPGSYLSRALTLSLTALSPDGRALAAAIVTADASRPVVLYALGAGLPTPTATLTLPDTARLIAWSADATRLATATMDRRVSVWDAQSGLELAAFAPDASDPVSAIALNADGTELMLVGRAGPRREPLPAA